MCGGVNNTHLLVSANALTGFGLSFMWLKKSRQNRQARTLSQQESYVNVLA